MRKYKANREDWGRIRKLPSGRFQASYIGPDSATYNGPITYTARTDARAWLARVRGDIERGRWQSPKAASAEVFGMYAEQWVAQRTSGRGQPLRPKTATEYRRQISKGLSSFAHERLEHITPAKVRTWHAGRMSAGKTAAGSEARLLRAIMNTAVEDGIISSNPVPAKLTKSRTGRSFRPPTPDELAIILDVLDERFRLGVLIAANGGLRLSEWRALRRRDLNLIDGRYRINVHRQAQWVNGSGWVVDTPKSARGVRDVTLPSWLTAGIDEHLATRVGSFPDSLLFAPNGTSEFLHDSQFNRSWNVARDAAGVRGIVREHDLRDLAGSNLLEAGATIIEVRDFLGHASARTTEQYYLHRLTDRSAELADLMPEPVQRTNSPVRSISA